MKRILHSIVSLLAFGILALSPVAAQVLPVPPMMNFQGRLAKPDGTPVADGTYSVRFSLWDAVSEGTELWNQTLDPINVRNGVFGVLLSGFPAGVFNGDVWLEIKIGEDAALTPRQQMVSVAYAMKADSVKDGAITTNSLADGAVTAGKIDPGVFTGAGLWSLFGNSGTDPLTHFLGTTDDQPLLFKVNNRRAMQYQYAENTATAGFEFRSMNLLGGSEINSIGAGVVGATIAGGGLDYFTGTDYPNQITAHFGTVGGGAGNTASGSNTTVGGGVLNTAGGFYATVGGGISNTASDYGATVAGGAGNTASNDNATIGGGYQNTTSGENTTVGGGALNTASGLFATIGGGNGNTASGENTTVAGGYHNAASLGYATVGGGFQNSARNYHATVAGGSGNDVRGFAATVGGGGANYANADYATIPGGYSNSANGIASFAAGHKAYAAHEGAFVWSDNSHSLDFFASTAPNQFCIQAYGGMVLETGQNAWLYTSSTAGEKNRYFMLLNSPQTVSASGLKAGGILCADSYGYANPGKNDLVVKGTVSIGGYWNDPNFKLVVNGNVYSYGSYGGSDARWKREVTSLDNALDKILNLRGVSFLWDKATDPELNFPDGKQIGFIAQEVEKVLPELVSTDSKGYKAVAYANVVPVLVEAVKTLNGKVKTLSKDNDALQAKNNALEARLTAIENALAQRK